MRITLLSICLSFFTCLSLSAQTTALDWTKQDCNTGATHHLYSELDAGAVVVQEYVMMNCSSCIIAGNVLKPIITQYAASNPGKVKFYQTVYDNTTSCSILLNWAQANGFSAATHFRQGATEVNYYGGMGMPTTVVMGGGANHKVYFVHLGSLSSTAMQNTLKAAIDLAISESVVGIEENESRLAFSVFPSPANETITIHADNLPEVDQLRILDLTGKSCLNVPTGSADGTFDISVLRPGIYVALLENKGLTLGAARFVKK